jgi:hypothetical protein
MQVNPSDSTIDVLMHHPPGSAGGIPAVGTELEL